MSTVISLSIPSLIFLSCRFYRVCLHAYCNCSGMEIYLLREDEQIIYEPEIIQIGVYYSITVGKH